MNGYFTAVPRRNLSSALSRDFVLHVGAFYGPTWLPFPKGGDMGVKFLLKTDPSTYVLNVPLDLK